MRNIILKLIPARLANPDLDMRYVLADLLVEKSGGLIEADGYDYEAGTGAMLIYLSTADLERAVGCINDVVMNTQVLGNDLQDALEIIVDP